VDAGRFLSDSTHGTPPSISKQGMRRGIPGGGGDNPLALVCCSRSGHAKIVQLADLLESGLRDGKLGNFSALAKGLQSVERGPEFEAALQNRARELCELGCGCCLSSSTDHTAEVPVRPCIRMCT